MVGVPNGGSSKGPGAGGGVDDTTIGVGVGQTRSKGRATRGDVNMDSGKSISRPASMTCLAVGPVQSSLFLLSPHLLTALSMRSLAS